MPNILCGNCKQYHPTVQEVRTCHTGAVASDRLIDGYATMSVPDYTGNWSSKSAEPVSEGIYIKDDTVYKAIESQNGRMYAKELVVEDEFGTTSWNYAPGAISRLSLEDKATLERAAQYGKITGVCAMCGRKLTNEESIERGIGPICLEKM